MPACILRAIISGVRSMTGAHRRGKAASVLCSKGCIALRLMRPTCLLVLGLARTKEAVLIALKRSNADQSLTFLKAPRPSQHPPTENKVNQYPKWKVGE